jgi:hypothetical protein
LVVVVVVVVLLDGLVAVLVLVVVDDLVAPVNSAAPRRRFLRLRGGVSSSFAVARISLRASSWLTARRAPAPRFMALGTALPRRRWLVLYDVAAGRRRAMRSFEGDMARHRKAVKL